MSDQSINEIKAEAVKEFVNIMIGARNAGFVDSSTPTLAEVYRVAQGHVDHAYGVEMKSLVDAWGHEVTVLCGGVVVKDKTFTCHVCKRSGCDISHDCC